MVVSKPLTMHILVYAQIMTFYRATALLWRRISGQPKDDLITNRGEEIMTDREILIWIHQRLTEVHGESPFVDHMHKLREVIHATPYSQQSNNGTVTMISNDILDEIRRGS